MREMEIANYWVFDRYTWRPEAWNLAYKHINGNVQCEIAWEGDEHRLKMTNRNDHEYLSLRLSTGSLPEPTPTSDDGLLTYIDPASSSRLSIKLLPAHSEQARAVHEDLQRGEEVAVAEYSLELPHQDDGWSAPLTDPSYKFSVRVHVPSFMRSLIAVEFGETYGEESAVLTLPLPDQHLFNPLSTGNVI